MACNIHYEAANQSWSGQVAVGRTVLTRMSGGYMGARSACATIYKWAQFSWTLSGAKPMPQGRAWEQAVAAAELSMRLGPNGMTHYFATWLRRPPPWSQSPLCNNSGTIGDHRFYFCADREFRSFVDGITVANVQQFGPVTNDQSRAQASAATSTAMLAPAALRQLTEQAGTNISLSFAESVPEVFPITNTRRVGLGGSSRSTITTPRQPRTTPVVLPQKPHEIEYINSDFAPKGTVTRGVI